MQYFWTRWKGGGETLGTKNYFCTQNNFLYPVQIFVPSVSYPLGKYYKEAKMEEKKEVENIERLRKSSKLLNLSTQRQRMNLREINDLTADFVKYVTNGWNDNQRELLQVIKMSTRKLTLRGAREKTHRETRGAWSAFFH